MYPLDRKIWSHHFFFHDKCVCAKKKNVAKIILKPPQKPPSPGTLCFKLEGVAWVHESKLTDDVVFHWLISLQFYRREPQTSSKHLELTSYRIFQWFILNLVWWWALNREIYHNSEAVV